jgi:transglutaminase-like putative cysteine protease
MPTLTISHVTAYRYRRPVALGEHRMMLRPRESHDQRVIDAILEITPRPSSLRFVQDVFGNHIGIAQFTGRAMELSIRSTVLLEQTEAAAADMAGEGDAAPYPFRYDDEEQPDLAPFIERRDVDPDDAVGPWARTFAPANDSIGCVALLARMTSGVRRGFRYRRREEKGIQRPVETLAIGEGSCRDFAVLMIEAARSLGFAARFASGYLTLPFRRADEPEGGAGHGSTHAWAQVYVPATGWIDVDPTSGTVGKAGLVTVAVVRDPRHATPLHGTFMGAATDHLRMDVDVSFAPGAAPRSGARSSSPLLQAGE